MVAPETSRFLRACRGKSVDATPVWFMRQAGRSLPEYLEIRGDGSILEAIRKPELSAEITLQPVRRYGVDAAILFSDIVVPAAAIGFGIDVKPGVGPMAEHPFRSRSDLSRLRPLEPELDVPYVLETVRILAGELDIPLIGFSGAPFTVASYLIEGRPSRTYEHTKAMMAGDPDLFHEVMSRLADHSIEFMRAQVEAGAQAIQLFDSWAGALSLADYTTHVQPHSARVFEALADLHVPRIHFGVNTGELLGAMADAGADVVGVDWRIPLDEARKRLPPHVALQGNLDPAILGAPWPVVQQRTHDVLRSAAIAASSGDVNQGHIFNLGHGVTPSVDPSVLERVVEYVHETGPLSAEDLT